MPTIASIIKFGREPYLNVYAPTSSLVPRPPHVFQCTGVLMYTEKYGKAWVWGLPTSMYHQTTMLCPDR